MSTDTPIQFTTVHQVLAAAQGIDREQRISVLGRLTSRRWTRRGAQEFLEMLAASVGHYDVNCTIIADPVPGWRRLTHVRFVVFIVGPAYGVQAYLHLLEGHGYAR